MSFDSDSLNSTELLSLLYFCERERKKEPVSENSLREFYEIFSVRLETHAESSRIEFLSAHLMSVEDVDVFDQQFMSSILESNNEQLLKIKKMFSEIESETKLQ